MANNDNEPSINDQSEGEEEEEEEASTVDLHLQEALDSVLTAAATYNPASLSGAASTSAQVDSSEASNRRKHYFLKELRCMMYGVGDNKQPYTECVELLEEIVVEFVKNFTVRALEIGKNGKIQLEDVWYLIRRDPKKYCRVKDLLTMNEELRKARKAFDEAKY